MGIRSLDLRVNRLFFESEIAKVRFVLFKERISLVTLFVKSDRAICSCHFFNKSDGSECHKKGKRMVKRTNLKRITLKKNESLSH